MAELDICRAEEASYDHRIYNDEQHNFCSVPEKGFDAVLFAAIGVTFTCLAPRKHYAIVMLLFGAALQLLNIEVNIRELSNALNLWIGISPAKMFFYIFLPPLLLDSAVRIDFFVFKKVAVQVFVFAFFVVACNTVLLAVFMLYILNLRNEGWEWTDAFLFACMIASTDALAVTAIMKDGSGPERLIVLAEGESLFNDATSIVFFDLFWPRFKDSIKGTLKHEPLLKIVGKMALDVAWLAVGGALIGLVFGYITRLLFKHLQNRITHTPVGEVGITVGVSYLAYYVAESVVEVSGVIAVVVYGLYGAATTQWDISSSARESKVFSGFWDVTQLLTNGIVFFYAGASATNFFYRCEEDLFDNSDEDGLKTILAWLPGVYVGIFLLRFLEIAAVTPLVSLLGDSLKLNEIVFISLAGLRGALALILAQELLQYEFPVEPGNDFLLEKKVRAQSALWVCGFVLLTLMINAPGIPFLMQICGLQEISPTQLKYRQKADQALQEFTKGQIEERKKGSYGTICGVNWKLVEGFILDSEETPTAQESANKKGIFPQGSLPVFQNLHLPLLESLCGKAPLIPSTDPEQEASKLKQQLLEDSIADQPFAGTSTQQQAVLGESEMGKKSSPMISTGGSSTPAVYDQTKSTGVVLLTKIKDSMEALEQGNPLLPKIKRYIEGNNYSFLAKNQKFFTSSASYFNLVSQQPEELKVEKSDDSLNSIKAEKDQESSFLPRSFPSTQAPTAAGFSVSVQLLDASDHEADEVEIREKKLTEARFRMLMGLKKYFQQRSAEGHLSSRGFRLLQWACDVSMEEPEDPIKIWDLIVSDIKSRITIKVVSKLRYLLRKASVGLKNWPKILGSLLNPVLSKISSLTTHLLTEDFTVAVEAAIECWIGLHAYKLHSAWLVNEELAIGMSKEVTNQLELVWEFIITREVEAPERFEAIQTYRTQRALLQAQMSFVDGLFDSGLLEESEHEHLKKDLEHKRALLIKKGPKIRTSEILEFLKSVPFFSNISDEVFREIISTCQLLKFRGGELISMVKAPSGEMESFSFHLVVNGILRCEFFDSQDHRHEYYLGRGGVFGLLSALSGERPAWMGKAFAELNAVGQGPSILTVPHTTLQNIHSKALNGEKQYQQVELDLFRVAALYIVQYFKDPLLHLTNSFFITQLEGNESEEHVRILGGGLLGINSEESKQSTSERVKQSHQQSMELLKDFKESLLKGDLVLLPPSSTFLQDSSAVLLLGSLELSSKKSVGLSAPMVLPWLSPEPGHSMQYQTGSQGAILVTCPHPQGSTSSSSTESGVRIGGETMAHLPPNAAAMMNEFIK